MTGLKSLELNKPNIVKETIKQKNQNAAIVKKKEALINEWNENESSEEEVPLSRLAKKQPMPS